MKRQFAALHPLVLLLLSTVANCAQPDWWQTANFYQIYPRSFQDSNDDGIGDLNGITARLPYLRELGITAIWLSPIFQSPMVDFGYDCSDYTKIAPEYGTLEHFERLVAECRRLQLKLILDFVPNHTSDQHEWFVQSAARNPVYSDYYVWHPGYMMTNGSRVPPNNWLSMFRGPAWTFHEGRGQWYLHQFVKEQPDLNYRNPAVVAAMKSVLRLWLERGVDGFRIDAVKFLFEVALDERGKYPDEPLSSDCADELDTCYLRHELTQDLPDTYDMIYQWRQVVDEHARLNGGETRIIMTEAYTTLANTIRYYGEGGDGGRNGAQVPFNFELITNWQPATGASRAMGIIGSWLQQLPAPTEATGERRVANWVLGNHDNPRVATRFGRERADLFNILLQTLPGIAITYYGEELALVDHPLSWSQTVDPAGLNAGADRYAEFSRDPCRLPMPWSADQPSAGFSGSPSTWLPVPADFALNNVRQQREQPFSHWKTFRSLTALRREPTLSDGDQPMRMESVAEDEVLVYTRTAAGHETLAVMLNLADRQHSVDLGAVFGWPEGAEVEVIVASVDAPYLAGDVLRAADAVAYANVGVVFVLIE